MLATLFSKGLPFVTIPIFTRIMSIDDYGIVNTYASWVSITTVLVSLTMYMSVRSSFIDREKEKEEVLCTITNFNIVFGVILILLICIFFNDTKVKSLKILGVCCLVQSIFSSLLNNYIMFLMMKKDYKKRFFYMVIPELLATIVSIAFVIGSLNQEKYYLKIVSSVIVYFIFSVIIWWTVNKNIKKRFVISHLKYALFISLPLVFHGLSLYVLNQSDKVMITLLRNSEETGIYSLIYSIGMIVTAFTFALEGIWIPWYTEKLKNNSILEINIKVKYYTRMVSLFMGMLVLISPDLIKLMAPQEYWSGKITIPTIVLANYVIFIYTFFVNNEHYHKKTLLIAVNSIVGAIINIILNVLFIPLFGYLAAACTTLISYIIIMFLHVRVSRQLEPELYPLRIFRHSFMYVVISCVIYYITLEYVFGRWVASIVYCSCIIWINRVEIYNFIKKMLGNKNVNR